LRGLAPTSLLNNYRAFPNLRGRRLEPSLGPRSRGYVTTVKQFSVSQPNRNLLRSEKGAQEAWHKLAGGAGSSQSDADAVAIEMAVLLAQPQPHWPLLVRVNQPASHWENMGILELHTVVLSRVWRQL